MSQFNRLNVPTLSTDQLLVNGFYFNTQYAGNIIANGAPVPTTPLTTEVIINDQTKNQALFANIIALEGEIGGNVNPNLVVVDARLNALEGNVAILQGNVVSINNQIANINSNVSGLNANTQYLRAPYNGQGGSTSYFTNGLQVWNGANESGNGIFSYVDGATPGSQIQLKVQDSKNVVIKGSTTITAPQNGLVSVAANNNTAMTFSVGNSGVNNVEVSMNGNINLKGDGNSRVSVYTKSQLIPVPASIKTAEIVGTDEANVLGKKITAKSDDGGQLLLTADATVSGSTATLTGSGGSVFSDSGGTNVRASNGKGIDIQCSSGNSNSYINIGTEQGALDTGYTTINIGNSNTLTARTSSTFLNNDIYLPKIPANPGGWDNMMYIGLPTPFSGPLFGPLKSTFNPYFRSISLFCPEATTNSFIQASGLFSVNVGLGAISLMTGTGGMALTSIAGLLALNSAIGGITATTAGGAIALTTGAGTMNFTTGAAPIVSSTNIGDILLKAGYAYDSTPQLSLGSVYIQARDYTYITPDKGIIVGEGIVTPYNAVLLDTMGYSFSGNIFSNVLIGNLTGVYSNTFITPNSVTTLVNPINSNLIYSNLQYETGTAYALLRNMDINGTIATSSAATVPSGNLGANVAITDTTTKFYFPDNTLLPLNANVKLFVYVQDTPNIANYRYSTWQANAQIQSNISGLVNAYVEPNPPSYNNYMTVLGNVGILSDLDVFEGNIKVASSSFPAQQTFITRNSITTTGNITCDTLNYTTLNPPIVIPNVGGGGVNSIIAGTNVSISPLNGQGNVVINCTLPNIAGVSSIIAGNGIQISPVGGTGNVTVELAGSVIPPGGYLPINGGTMTGPIYQFPSSNINDNTVKKYRPVTSYQPPFPSIGPPTFTGEILTFFNGDNSPEQTGFTGWFPENMVPYQPNVMTDKIPINALQKFYEYIGGTSSTSTAVNAQIDNFQIGDHIKGGYFPYQNFDAGLIGGSYFYISNVLNGKEVILYKVNIAVQGGGPNSTSLPEVDFIYTGGEQGAGSVNYATIVASIDPQGEPQITCNRNPANGSWEGYLNLAVNKTSQFMASNVDSSQAVIWEYFDDTKIVNKLMTVGLTSGTYASGENAISGIFLNPMRYADTKLIYIYGRFDTVTQTIGLVTTTVNNIFAYHVDNDTIIPLTTFTTDPLYLATPPVGSNGRVNGVYVSQIIAGPTNRYGVYFWGDFTGPNQMGIATPPTGTNWTNNGFAVCENDDWTVAKYFITVSQTYNNCGAGLCFNDTAATIPNTWFFLFVGSFNSVTKNTVMSLTFNSYSLDRYSTDFCFSNGSVGTSAINKVKNIQLMPDGIFFLGNWVGTGFNGTTDVPIYSIAGTNANGTFDTSGIWSNPFLEICGSSNTGFWLQGADPIETTCIQTTDVNTAPVNYLIGTEGYQVGNNGGGVLTFPAAQINDPTFLPTKQPISGILAYEVRNIPTSNSANAVQLTCSLNNNNFWWSQTFNSDNPITPPSVPVVNAINGAFFAVLNTEMDKIVFSGQDTDYASVTFIAGDAAEGDKLWYWQSQVGAIDYYAGATLYANVTASGNVIPGPTSDTWGTVLINGNVASKSIDMNNFDIYNANTIYSGNTISLRAPNAVEIGEPVRRPATIYTPVIDNVFICDQWANFVNSYVDSDHLENPDYVAVFDRLSVSYAASYDDGLNTTGYATCELRTNIGGVDTLLTQSNQFSFGNIDRTTFPPQMTPVVFPNDVAIPIITSPDYYYFRFQLNVSNTSPSYAYYGEASAAIGYPTQTAAIYLPTSVNDPIDFFNVYGDAFFGNASLHYGNIICENPLFPNISSTLNHSTLFFKDILDAYQSYMTSQECRMINSYYTTYMSGTGLISQNTAQSYTSTLGSTGLVVSKPGFYSSVGPETIILVDNQGSTTYNHQINYQGFQSITNEFNATSGQFWASLYTNGRSPTLTLRSILGYPTPTGEQHIFSITNGATGDCTMALTSPGAATPRNLVISSAGLNTVQASQTTIQTPSSNNSFVVNTAGQYLISGDIDNTTNPTFEIWNSNVSTASYPAIKMNKTTTASVAGNVVSAISSWARDGTNTSKEWARISVQAQNVGAGNQDGALILGSAINGTVTTMLTIDGSVPSIIANANFNLSNKIISNLAISDVNQSTGVVGSILKSTGTNVEWATAASVFTPNLGQVLGVGNTSDGYNINLNGNILQNCSQITATGDLTLNPVGSIECSGKNINVTNGSISNIPLIHGQNNANIIVEGKGTGDIILKTNNIDRITVNDTGVINFQGGASYDNTTNTFTATNFTGLASTATGVATTFENTAITRYIAFKSGSGAYQQDYVDTNLFYNPSTNLLTCGSISGTINQFTIGSTSSVDTTMYPVLVGDNTTIAQTPNTKSSLVFNASTGALSATSFSGSGSGLSASSIPTTSLTRVRYHAGVNQSIAAGALATLDWSTVYENNGFTETAGTISFPSAGTYSITVNGTWSSIPVAVAFGISIWGSVRIYTSGGFSYVGSAVALGTGSYGATTSAIINLGAAQTIQIQAYNPSSGALNYDSLVEIVRLCS